ncbi:MAG: hypothetical protein CM15mP8_4290 [Methanobacteriota archaeon]|nr:MAG: hypothetical protein CM15mP8_4290 [Euryarchaeota archaeon]
MRDSIRCQKIATLNDETVGVKFKEVNFSLTFHPELNNDRRFHRWLIGQAIDKKSEYFRGFETMNIRQVYYVRTTTDGK